MTTGHEVHAAECGGIVAVVRASEGESRAMATDRAWLIARWLAADRLASPEAAERASKLWVWQARAGCEYDDRPALAATIASASVFSGVE
jgi:hypothetical protein